MPDLFEGMTDDDDAFALPGDEQAVAKIPGDEPADERLRDEQGRFASQEEETPEVETEETPEVVAEVTAEEPETQTDYADRVAALERRLADKDEFIGRLTNEVGESRKLLESLDERLQTPAAPPVAITQDLIDTNPGYATVLAREQGNDAALQIAYEAWKMDDPATAGAWLAREQMKAELEPQLAAYQKQIEALEARIAPAAQAADQSQLSSAARAAVAANPGLEEFLSGEDLGKIADEFPDIGDKLIVGTPDQKVRAVTALFQIHRGRVTDTLRVTQEEIARQQAEQAQVVREEAFVASASTTSAGVKPSAAELIAADWDADRSALESGWNV